MHSSYGWLCNCRRAARFPQSPHPHQESLMTTSTVLVLGGRGRFGLAAVQAFAQAGWQVIAQVRPGAATLPVMAGVRWLQAAPADTATLVRAAAGATAVVQALSPEYTHRAWKR